MALCGGIKRYFSPVLQRATAKLLHYLLAFFACLSPCWTFFFIKTPQTKMAKIDNKVSEMKNIIPNPFSNQLNETGPTKTKRHGSI